MLSTICGGLVAVRGTNRLHLLLGTGAGMLLGATFFDLLPESIEAAHVMRDDCKRHDDSTRKFTRSCSSDRSTVESAVRDESDGTHWPTRRCASLTQLQGWSVGEMSLVLVIGFLGLRRSGARPGRFTRVRKAIERRAQHNDVGYSGRKGRADRFDVSRNGCDCPGDRGSSCLAIPAIAEVAGDFFGTGIRVLSLYGDVRLTARSA